MLLTTMNLLTGANITSEDLLSYRVREYSALTMPLRGGDVLHTLRPPSSGILLGFMLRVLEGLALCVTGCFMIFHWFTIINNEHSLCYAQHMSIN